MVHFRGGRAAVDVAAYPRMDAFFEDLAECWRREIRALGEAGCTFVQLDDTNVGSPLGQASVGVNILTPLSPAGVPMRL